MLTVIGRMRLPPTSLLWGTYSDLVKEGGSIRDLFTPRHVRCNNSKENRGRLDRSLFVLPAFDIRLGIDEGETVQRRSTQAADLSLYAHHKLVVVKNLCQVRPKFVFREEMQARVDFLRHVDLIVANHLVDGPYLKSAAPERCPVS